MQSPTTTSTSTSSSIDSLTCQWGDCHERCDSAESLYDHVCERHVGRKSTNNLNLTCNWGTCQTTTVKRDHITSHIRVHVPLKPHKCDFCGKSFKRPQDLKKHVKTHADESVLLRTPDATSSHQVSNSSNYQNGHKHNGYVPDNSSYNQSNAGYGQYTGGNTHSFYSAPTSHTNNFTPVYYQMPQTVSLAGGPGFETHRGHDQLNSFFREVKNNAIDPRSYYDLGHRLGSVDSLGLPIFNNMQAPYQAPMAHHGGQTMGYAAPALPTPQYSLPFSELKTKSDLMSIDQFLQQLQETVYETPAAPSPDSYTSDPPALTPASYTSDSPVSAHSSHVMSPARSGMASYPQIRSTSTLHDLPISYPHMDGPPASGLGNSFDDYDGRRRHSGNILQRAQPMSSPLRNATEIAGNMSPPALKQAPKPAEPGDFSKRRERRDSDERSDTSNDERYEAWVQNMRTIDALRKFVKERLQKLDEPAARSSHSPPQANKSLYPTLRPINAS